MHIAGSHLEDPKTGEFNLPFLETRISGRGFPRGDVRAVGRRPGGRAGESEERFARSSIWRGRTSGSRIASRDREAAALLDELLDEGRDATRGRSRDIDRIAHGHLAAAYMRGVARKRMCCLATRSAAQTFGLDFVPLRLRAVRPGDAQADHGAAGGAGVPRRAAAGDAAAQAGSAGGLRYVADGGGVSISRK